MCGDGRQMKPAAYITTGWDDGHPLDFRVAGLLARAAGKEKTAPGGGAPDGTLPCRVQAFLAIAASTLHGPGPAAAM